MSEQAEAGGFPLPVGARRSRMDAGGGVKLLVVEMGPADGPPVLLLHGFPESWYSTGRSRPRWAANRCCGARCWASSGWRRCRAWATCRNSRRLTR